MYQILIFFFFKHYPLRNQLGSTCHRILAIAQLRAKIIKKAPHFQNEPISDLETSYYFQPCVWQQLMPGIHLDINETILFNNTIQLPKFLDILWPATTHIVFYSTIANTTYLSIKFLTHETRWILTLANVAFAWGPKILNLWTVTERFLIFLLVDNVFTPQEPYLFF